MTNVKFIVGGGDGGNKKHALFLYANDYKHAYDEMKNLYDNAFDKFQKSMDLEDYQNEEPINLRLAGPMIMMLSLSCELILKRSIDHDGYICFFD